MSPLLQKENSKGTQFYPGNAQYPSAHVKHKLGCPYMHVRQFGVHCIQVKSVPESKRVVYPALHLKQFLSEPHFKQFFGHDYSHTSVLAFNNHPSLQVVHLFNYVELLQVRQF